MNIPPDYYTKLAYIESSNNPNACSKTSSASGLYQFTEATWTGLGLDWNDRFDVALQRYAIANYTNKNASILANIGIPITCENLYAAHFLGIGCAIHILKEPADTELVDALPHNVLVANPFLTGMTVGDFENWLSMKFNTAKD